MCVPVSYITSILPLDRSADQIKYVILLPSCDCSLQEVAPQYSNSHECFRGNNT